MNLVHRLRLLWRRGEHRYLTARDVRRLSASEHDRSLRRVSSLRRMTIPELVQRLINEGETLFVERKERDPKDGLGATVASFANILGGWLLIGVSNVGTIVADWWTT